MFVNRQARQEIRSLLKTDDVDLGLAALRRLPVHRTVRHLFAFLCELDEEVKNRAITTMGVLVADLAAQDMEAAREVMRRLMWSLNDESGSIGWGASQAMAEIMVNHEGLAGEYTHMLVSYMAEDGNYLENVLLQRELLRAIHRLAEARPQLLHQKGVLPYLRELSGSEDAQVRRLAARCQDILMAGETGSEPVRFDNALP